VITPYNRLGIAAAITSFVILVLMFLPWVGAPLLHQPQVLVEALNVAGEFANGYTLSLDSLNDLLVFLQNSGVLSEETLRMIPIVIVIYVGFLAIRLILALILLVGIIRLLATKGNKGKIIIGTLIATLIVVAAWTALVFLANGTLQSTIGTTIVFIRITFIPIAVCVLAFATIILLAIKRKSNNKAL